jgi:hypothetical protein
MATILLEYDKRNKAAMRLIEFIKEIGLFKISEPNSVNSITNEALKEADSKSLKKYSTVKSLMSDLDR